MHQPPHPGGLLKTFILPELGLSISAAARALGLSRHTMSAVANGQQAITPIIAVKLAKAFGGSAEHWLSMQGSATVGAGLGPAGNLTATVRTID